MLVRDPELCLTRIDTLNRYIGLRWSTPIPRKKVKLNRAAAAKREQSQSQSSSSSIIRQGKKIVGFVLAELDMAAGSLCLPCIMPTGSVGDTFDATTSLLRRIAAQARTDIDRENVRRRETSALQLPPLSEAWTMSEFRNPASLASGSRRSLTNDLHFPSQPCS